MHNARETLPDGLEGYEQHTWEPEWELLGNNFHLGTAREAVHEYCHY